MANAEYKAYLAKHRSDFIKLAEAQDKELAKLYIQAASEIKLRAADIIGNKTLTAAQAKIRIKSLLIEASRLSDGFKTILDKSLIDSADLGQEINKLIMGKYQDALKKEGINLNLGKILSKVNPEAINAVYNRIWTDGLKLSDRIWLLDRRTKQEIERIVMQNIVSGGSASNKVTLSALENLLNPGYKPAKLTSLHGRKVGYESSRLLRTSMSEAFNEGDRLSNLKNPGSTGLKLLNAVGACEICTPLDGLPVEQTGLPPIHPNCRCTTLEEVMSVDAFTNKWLDFMNNPDKYPDLQDWLINVYDKGGAKTLTAVKETVKEGFERVNSNQKVKEFIRNRDDFPVDLQPMITKYTEKEYNKLGANMYLHTSGKAGYAITKDGDLISVFSKPGAHLGSEAVEKALTEGATKLDCFGNPQLVEFYKNHGFTEYKRIKWDNAYAPKNWDYEKYSKPDIVFMEIKK